jgi:hypothetical protein
MRAPGGGLIFQTPAGMCLVVFTLLLYVLHVSCVSLKTGDMEIKRLLLRNITPVLMLNREKLMVKVIFMR